MDSRRPATAGASRLSPMPKSHGPRNTEHSTPSQFLASNSPLSKTSHLRGSPAGSPSNFIKSKPLISGSTTTCTNTSIQKPRPATALTLRSSTIIRSMISSDSNRRIDTLNPDSDPTTELTVSSPIQRTTQRCSGCGSYAELCMVCFSHFRQRDNAIYKQKISRSVEILLERASARAWARQSAVIRQWIFGVWKRETQQRQSYRHMVIQTMERQRMRRWWTTWQLYIYQQRTLGAMLYARQQHNETREKSNEVSTLHGEIFALHADTVVHNQVHYDSIQSLQQALDTCTQHFNTRTQELVKVRHELNVAQQRITVLEDQAIDPKEHARLQEDNVELRKMVFQLASTLCQRMETQLELVTKSEGRQNLSNVFTKDVIQSIDQPEHCGYYSSLEADSLQAPIDRADRILQQWVTALVGKERPSRIKDFHTSLNDGTVWLELTKVLYTHMSRSKGGGYGQVLTSQAFDQYLHQIQREERVGKRLDMMFGVVGQALWMPRGLLTVSDIEAGDVEWNFAALSYLFCTAPPLVDPSHEALWADLHQQLTSMQTQWHELRETDPNDLSFRMKLKLTVTQTLDVNKRIEKEDQQARQGHVLWWKSMRIILRKCFVSYARRGRGQAGIFSTIPSALDEHVAFATLPTTRLMDLERSDQDLSWEFKLMQIYHSTVYMELARIYHRYTKRRDPQREEMLIGDFHDLLHDCRIVDKGFTTHDFHQVVRTMDPHAKETISSSYRISPICYLEGLIRIARIKWSFEIHTTSLSESFSLLLDKYILPLAFRTDIEHFRHQMESPKLRRLFLRYTAPLHALYAQYGEEEIKSNKKRIRLTGYAFCQCLIDRKILDLILTNDKVLSLLHYIVPSRDQDPELTFEQFQHALIAIACYKCPDPYLSLERRCEMFLATYMSHIETTEKIKEKR